jgi:hypothetical protein
MDTGSQMKKCEAKFIWGETMKKKVFMSILLLIIVISILELKKETVNENNINEELVLTNQVIKNGEMVVEASPGGGFVAGTPAGCWWSIHFSFEEIKNKSFKVIATHPKTNQQFSEIELARIGDKGIDYNGLTRVSSEFKIPSSGVWKFDVYIDGDLLGSVFFDVPDSSLAYQTDLVSKIPF